jgi:hypothetical protein
MSIFAGIFKSAARLFLVKNRQAMKLRRNDDNAMEATTIRIINETWDCMLALSVDADVVG